MQCRNVSSGTEWESTVGYSRAVRGGPHVHVLGTTATDENGEIVGAADPYVQTTSDGEFSGTDESQVIVG